MLLVVVSLAAASLGCEGRPRRRELPPEPAPQKVRAPTSSAAVAELPIEVGDGDPAAPAGDLAAELEAFTTMRDCVTKHRVEDPVVADALDAMGYDSFVGDACRSLRAMKEKTFAPCREVLASAVRDRCESNVAILVGDESLCPLRDRVAGVPEHDPTCLAGARRDVRPCAAFLGFQRAACEGFVARDVSRCGTDPRCRRHVTRWKSSLPVPKGEAPLPSGVELTLRALDPTADAGVRDETHALVAEAEAGVLLVKRASGTQVLLGDVLPLAGSEVRAGFLIELPDTSRPKALLKGGKHKVTLRLPPSTVLEAAPRAAIEVEITSLTEVPNTPVQLKLSVDVGERPNLRRAELTVRTWVRDVARPPARPVSDPSPFTTLPPEP